MQDWYTKATYIFFTIAWFAVILFNDLLSCVEAAIFVLPIIVFAIGFCFSEYIKDRSTIKHITSISFLNVSLILSVSILKMVDPINDKRLNHAIFWAIIFSLLPYIQLWLPEPFHHIMIVSRSCMETMSITLFIYVLSVFFITHGDKVSDALKSLS